MAASAEEAGARRRRPAEKAAPKAKAPKETRRDDNVVVGYLKSREGRSMMNTVARGVFGMLRKRR